ncbi:MAG: DUF551 domain-containing protein [Gammaproteobacteria bacterium]|nr:DUF551 domain-containing protein [Gammaproteobacteria bacterium]
MTTSWIKTADRMPEPGLHILFWDGEMIDVGDYDDGLFHDLEGRDCLPECFVTHWMPFPEPPEPVEEE